jgi:hypothetical protein
MDALFEILRRDAIDSGRFLRWIGRMLRVPTLTPCRQCNDNPLKSCAQCYEDGLNH